MRNGLFITGTGTGVGKTVITAALARYMQERGCDIGVMKPIETGSSQDEPPSSDAYRLRQASRSGQSLDSVCPYRFPDPIAPLAAAHRRGKTIDLFSIQTHYRRLQDQFEWVLVEGVGGLMVPLTKQETVRDLIQLLDLPCLVVGHATLGGVNHLLLTLEALENVHIQVLAIILIQCEASTNQDIQNLQMASTIDLARTLSKPPVLGPLRYVEAFNRDW